MLHSSRINSAGSIDSTTILKYWNVGFIVLLSLGLYFLYGNAFHLLISEENYLRIIMFFLAIGLIANGKNIIQENIKKKWLIFFILSELFFVFWHLNFFSFKKLFIDASLFLIFFYVLPQTRSFKWLGIVGWVCITIIILLILPIWPFIWDVDKSYKAAFRHRNELGYFLVTIFIFISFLKIKIHIKYFLAFLYLVCIFLTFSRTTLIASALVWCWLLFPHGKMKIIFLTLALHGTIIFAWNSNPTYLLNFVGGEKYKIREFEPASLERLQVLQSGLIAYAENPIMGRSELFTSGSGNTKGSHVHNFYLSHLISYGIFPSIAVGLMFYLFFQKSGIRVRLMIINLAIFAAFQGFFDTFQSAYFFITVLCLIIFNYFDSKERPPGLNLGSSIFP